MSTGTIIAKKEGRYYNIRIEFRAQRSYVLPILQDWWSSQEGANRIIANCGRGIKMVFVRMPKEQLEEGSAFAGWVKDDHDMNNWHNGEQFDHSPNACLSPIQENMSKMVLVDYYQEPLPVQQSYATLDEAKKATNMPFLYIWDGESWTYEKNLPKTRKFGKGTAWSRTRT